MRVLLISSSWGIQRLLAEAVDLAGQITHFVASVETGDLGFQRPAGDLLRGLRQVHDRLGKAPPDHPGKANRKKQSEDAGDQVDQEGRQTGRMPGGSRRFRRSQNRFKQSVEVCLNAIRQGRHGGGKHVLELGFQLGCLPGRLAIGAELPGQLRGPGLHQQLVAGGHIAEDDFTLGEGLLRLVHHLRVLRLDGRRGDAVAGGIIVAQVFRLSLQFLVGRPVSGLCDQIDHLRGPLAGRVHPSLEDLVALTLELVRFLVGRGVFLQVGLQGGVGGRQPKAIVLGHFDETFAKAIDFLGDLVFRLVSRMKQLRQAGAAKGQEFLFKLRRLALDMGRIGQLAHGAVGPAVVDECQDPDGQHGHDQQTRRNIHLFPDRHAAPLSRGLSIPCITRLHGFLLTPF